MGKKEINMTIQEIITTTLETSKLISLENMNQISEIIKNSEDNNILHNLLQSHLLPNKVIPILHKAIQDWKTNEQTDRFQVQITDPDLWFLSDQVKKEIMLAYQMLLDKICTLEEINQCFIEQAETKEKIRRNLLLGQIMVKNRYLSADRFLKLHKEIERTYQQKSWEVLIEFSRYWKISQENDVLQIVVNSIPQTFGDYKIIEEVARGGMGVVYKAWDKKLQRTVALKVLKLSYHSPKIELQRFHREARLAARLNHPNIVSIYDAGEYEGVHYFTMDFVEGRTLNEYMASGEHSMREKLDIIHQISLALDYAHTQNIIHRDVKPENIIVDMANRPLLTDFSLAKGLKTHETTQLTQTGEMFGTPLYMSPEQVRGEHIDARSDIYSLGAVLYELLAGKPPFYGLPLGEIITAVLTKNPIPLKTINPKIDANLDAICAKAMEKEVQDRYQTAKAMAEDIKRFLYGEKIAAKPIPYYKRLLRKNNFNSTFFPMILSCIICLTIYSIFNYIYHNIGYGKAQENFNLAMQSLENRNYSYAFHFLAEASKNKEINAQITSILHDTADQHIQKAQNTLEQYKILRTKLKQQYIIEYETFKQAPKYEKLQRLLNLQNNKNKQHEIRSMLCQSFQNYWHGILCNPSNKNTYLGIMEVHLQKLQEMDDTYDYYWDTEMMHLLEKAKNTHNNTKINHLLCKLNIKSIPSAEIHIYKITDLYLRKIPIPWKMSLEDSLEPWIQETKLIPCEKSYVGTSPTTWGSHQPGYYIIQCTAPGYKEQRQIYKLYGEQDIYIKMDLIKQNQELQNYHYVHLPYSNQDYNYYCSETEITQQEYHQFQPQTNATYMPMTNITHKQAQEYCQYLTNTSKNNITYRLPTIQEWQWIAGKIDNRTYVWGSTYDTLFQPENTLQTRSHYNYDITATGIKHLSSNVSEWCIDPSNPQNNITCGGNYTNTSPIFYEITNVQQHLDNHKSPTIGFRVLALVPKQIPTQGIK